MSYLDEINQKHPKRRSDAEKGDFRKYVKEKMESRGIKVLDEATSDAKNTNIVIGDPANAKAVFTAHYDTPASSIFPNIMIPRNIFLFWIYQFVPIIVLLALSLGCGYLVSAIAGGNMGAFLLGYLVVYYALYILFFRSFSNKNNYNDNTSGVATVLSLIDKLSDSERENVAFILFDNEEKGKKGSKAYFRDHENEMCSKLIINFDCVGNGNNIIFISKKGAEESPYHDKLKEAFVSNESFNVLFYPTKLSESNSDYKSFPAGIGCMACKLGKLGMYYTPRIHTKFDTVADNSNIEFICDCAAKFTSSMSAER